MAIPIHKLDWSKLETAPEYFRSVDLLPRIMGFLVRSVPLVKNEDGLISASASLKAFGAKVDSGELKWDMTNVVTREQAIGMFDLLKHPSRSKFLVTKSTRFKGGVPLFLSAFKELLGIGYSAWDLSDPALGKVTDAENYSQIKFISSGETLDYTEEELLELREASLTGRAKGELVVYSDTLFKCNQTSNAEFNEIPKRVRMSLLQLWDYHPARANEYMIRNHVDIDKPAEYSLVRDECVSTKSAKAVNDIAKELGW